MDTVHSRMSRIEHRVKPLMNEVIEILGDIEIHLAASWLNAKGEQINTRLIWEDFLIITGQYTTMVAKLQNRVNRLSEINNGQIALRVTARIEFIQRELELINSKLSYYISMIKTCIVDLEY